MHIQLCGSVRLETAGGAVALPGHQGRLAFAYLVLNRGRPVDRDELIEALWPESRGASRKATLRPVLSRLRTALGRGVLRGRHDLELHLGDDAWIDVEAASERLERAHDLAREASWREGMRAAGAAAKIAARPLLPGYDAGWIEAHRQGLAAVHVEALACGARCALELGGPELVVAERAARALIELAPFRESSYRLLMEVHRARGDVAQAVLVYELLRCLLRDELGIGPEAGVQRLHQSLLTGAES
jgi:DNA-binding SARP family transcriptional activator